MQISPYSSASSRQPPIYTQSPEQAAKTLDSNLETGLSQLQASKRLELYGANKLQQTKSMSLPMLYLNQLKNPLILVLMFGGLLSFYIENYIDAAAITFIVFFNATISFVQELKARKSLDALRAMAAPNCWVKRDNHWLQIPASQLVPGDLIKLTAGSLIPADARLISAQSLQVDESALTGESDAVLKQIQALDDPNLIVGDQTNQVFMSTSVVSGAAQALVIATGMQTQVGHIAKLIDTAETRLTPLQSRIKSLSKVLMWAAIFSVFITMILGIYQGMALDKIFTLGISLAVAAIPEGLATIVTIVLTLGAFQMMRSNALTKQLSAVETLGSTTVICSDKTGTLTQNQMQVKQIWQPGKILEVSGQGYQPEGEFLFQQQAVQPSAEPGLVALLQASVLCNEAQLIEQNGLTSILGQPTEGALVVAAAKAQIYKQNLLQSKQLLHTFAFDSRRKMMSVIVKDANNQAWLYVKGAPDVLLQNSKFVLANNQTEAIDNFCPEINQTIADFGHQALRTLAVGVRKLEDHQLNLPAHELETNLTLLGLYGIIDPPRPDAIAAIKTCETAGVRVLMITGDHVATAATIAHQMGITKTQDAPAITGQQLNEMSDQDLQQALQTTNVFARVTPEHKLRIVKALQANHEVVGMTGDGVNDAPALRSADIGIAMGITGTDVAKQAADLILLDDNFATIVGAIHEGRRIYDNIQKFLRQDLTTNVAEVTALLFAFILITSHVEKGELVIALTMTPLMILWINLVSDAIPSLALGADKAEADIMRRKPRPTRASFFANQLGIRIISRGLIMGAVSFLVFKYALDHQYSLAYAQTLAFMTLVFGQLFHVFDARTFSTVFERNPFSSPTLLMAVGFAGVTSVLMVYLPWGNLVLGTEALQISHLAIIALIATIPTFLLSAIKIITKTNWV